MCSLPPHMLTEDLKRVRVNWWRQMLNRFNVGESNGVWEVVSGHETGLGIEFRRVSKSFEPETK